MNTFCIVFEANEIYSKAKEAVLQCQIWDGSFTSEIYAGIKPATRNGVTTQPING